MRTIFSLDVSRTEELLAINIKTRKREIRGGRRHRRRRTPWFDLNEFSSALLCLCLLCARSSCSLFFLFHLLRPFPLGLRSPHSTADVALSLCSRGIKFGLRPSVELPRTCGRPLILIATPASLPASLVVSSPGTCGLPLELPVNIHVV